VMARNGRHAPGTDRPHHPGPGRQPQDRGLQDEPDRRIRGGEKAADYELQLQIYALAVRDIFGHPPAGACLYFLHPDVVREVDVSAAALEQTEKTIASFFEPTGGDIPSAPREPTASPAATTGPTAPNSRSVGEPAPSHDPPF